MVVTVVWMDHLEADENDNVLVVIIVAVGDKVFDMVTVDNVA